MGCLTSSAATPAPAFTVSEAVCSDHKAERESLPPLAAGNSERHESGETDPDKTVLCAAHAQGDTRLIGNDQEQFQAFEETKLEEEPGRLLKLHGLFSCTSDVVCQASARRPSTTGSYDKYIQTHGLEFSKLNELDEDRKWIHKKTDQGVKIYTFYDETRGVTCFKATTEMACTLQFLLDNLLEAKRRPVWDEMCIHGETLEQYFPYYRIAFFRFKSPLAIIANRELIVLARLLVNSDGSVVVSLSNVEHHPAALPSEGSIRMRMACGGYILRPTPKVGVLQVTFVGALDPQGWIPGWVKDIVAWKQGLVLARFKNQYNV